MPKLVNKRMTMQMIKMAKIMLTWVLGVLPMLVEVVRAVKMIKTAKDNVDLVVLPKFVQSDEGACSSNPSTAVDLRSIKLRRSLLKFY